MRAIVWLLLLAIIGLGAALPAGAAQAGDELGPEDLLFQDIPIVISSTRTEQLVRDAPNAVTVITAEEIEAMGALSLDQVLSLVPGLEVMRYSVSDINVSARGFDGPSSSLILVMVDGRSVYVDFFGVVSWDRLNVAMQDIERIEVIRGPGSALYGANAYLGTVNIVTKKARDLPSLYVRAGAGPEASLVTATSAASAGRSAIKASVRYDVADGFRNTMNPDANRVHDRDHTGLRNRMFNTTFEHELADGTELRFAGGMSKLRADILTGIGTFDYDGPSWHAQLNVDRGPWRFQAFYNRLDLDVFTIPTLPVPGVPLGDRILSNVLDVELQREVDLGDHQLLLGLATRRLSTSSPDILGPREAETLYAAFFQDEYRIGDDLTMFVGARFDEHPFSGFNVSPRGSLVWKLSETGRARLSVARSFRNPTQISNHSSIVLSGYTPAPTPLVMAVGNEDLDAETVTAYEVGYRASPHRLVDTSFDVFFNRLEDRQQFYVSSAGPPTVLSFRNAGNTKIWGAEATVEVRPRPWLRGFATWTFQSADGPGELSTPRNKGTFGLRGDLASYGRWALSGVYVSHHEFEPGGFTSLTDTTIDSNFTVDAYAGLRVWEDVELGVHARNIFHQVRRQYPTGDEIGSELMFTVTFQY